MCRRPVDQIVMAQQQLHEPEFMRNGPWQTRIRRSLTFRFLSLLGARAFPEFEANGLGGDAESRGRLLGVSVEQNDVPGFVERLCHCAYDRGLAFVGINILSQAKAVQVVIEETNRCVY